MTRFRKKPVEVEAVQWWPPGHIQHVPIPTVERGPRKDQPWIIATLEGPHIVSPGDWIITGVMGEQYPCKDEIFRMTYEAVGGDPTAPRPPQMLVLECQTNEGGPVSIGGASPGSVDLMKSYMAEVDEMAARMSPGDVVKGGGK